MFDTDYVVEAFEEATGVRLQRLGDDRGTQLVEQLAAKTGVILPRFEKYASPNHANDRFGGEFTVSIFLDDDDPDEGVLIDLDHPDDQDAREDGLEVILAEVGPHEYYVSARARRANVAVEFFSAASLITPEAAATWAVLISCLRRL